MRKKPGRPYGNKKRKDGKPYRNRRSTYTQGTIDILLEYHLERNDLLVSPYIRGLIKADLLSKYEIHATKGIIRLPKPQ